MPRGCSVEDCTGKHKGRGLCHRHLQRLQRLGSVDLNRPTFEERFWAKVDKTDPAGCWLWTGASTTFGYGVTSRGRRENNLLTHRASWEMAAGERVPPGMCVCHRCDVPACVRPDHLFLGTTSENLLDMRAKGRAHTSGPGLFGDKNTASRLTASDVVDIKQRLRDGESVSAVARDYPVCRSTIDWIKQGRTWRDVG